MSKTFLITGASRGIGYETALDLAAKEHTVIATARTAEKLEELSSNSKGGSIITVAADLTKDEDIERIVNTVSKHAKLDGIINNAGLVHKESFMDTDVSVFQKLMDVNLMGIVRVIQGTKSYLGKGSHILNISSMSGFQGSAKFGGLSAYGAAKAAVIGLSEVMSTEFAEEGIAVNCLCLGAVQTEMLAEAFPGYEAPVSAAEMGNYIANFILTGHQFYNGKVLPVALNNPS